MKNLNEHLYESLLSDEEDLINNDNALIDQFLKDNYIINGKYTIKNNVVDVNGSVKLKNILLPQLSNGLFTFGTVTGNFYCDHNKKLKNLIGSPKRVEGIFDCSNSKELISLEGAPEYIGADFLCHICPKIENLKYSPKYIGSSLYCSRCYKLTSLDSDTEYIGQDLHANACHSMLKFGKLPKKIERYIIISANSNISDYKELDNISKLAVIIEK